MFFLLPFCFTVVFMFNLFLVLVKKVFISTIYSQLYIFPTKLTYRLQHVFNNCKVLYKGMNGSVIFLRIPS